MYKSSPLAMNMQTYDYASSCASTSSAESSSASSTASQHQAAAPVSSTTCTHASARTRTITSPASSDHLDLLFPAASDFSSSSLAFPSWPSSDTLFTPPSTIITPSLSSTRASVGRVSSFVSDEDLMLGLDDLLLDEAPAPPRSAHDWEGQGFLHHQQPMVLAEPSHPALPVLVARPRTIKRVASSGASKHRPLHRVKTCRQLPIIKETTL